MQLALQGQNGRADIWEDRDGSYRVVFRTVSGAVVNKTNRFERSFPYFGDALKQAANWAMHGRLL